MNGGKYSPPTLSARCGCILVVKGRFNPGSKKPWLTQPPPHPLGFTAKAKAKSKSMAMALLSLPPSPSHTHSLSIIVASHSLLHRYSTRKLAIFSRENECESFVTGIKERRRSSGSFINWFAKTASEGDIRSVQDEEWGEPVSLGTAILPSDVDLGKLETLLFQWGNSLTQNSSLPLPAPIRVDKLANGVRLGYIKINNGVIENLVHIDVLVLPATENSQAMFRAIRNGRLKDMVPPGEPVIMQSLLQALKKSIYLAKL